MAVGPHVVPVVIATVPLYLLQIFVIVLVCCRRRKDEVFRTGFYTVYVALSIADCALMTVASLLIASISDLSEFCLAILPTVHDVSCGSVVVTALGASGLDRCIPPTVGCGPNPKARC